MRLSTSTTKEGIKGMHIITTGFLRQKRGASSISTDRPGQRSEMIVFTLVCRNVHAIGKPWFPFVENCVQDEVGEETFGQRMDELKLRQA